MINTVTAVVSTRDRYYTSLPNCLISIALQTVKPTELLIYDDGEHKDLRQDPLYQNIFKLLDNNGLEGKWKVLFGDRKGQVANHQRSINDSQCDWIWRIDDDNVLEANVLEKLLSNVTPEVGAVGGLVLDPKMTMPLTKLASNKIEDIYLGLNIQWSKHTGISEVDHLYSTFIYRKDIAKQIGGYCMDLSPVGHREETILSYSIKKAGYKLLVDPSIITWHLRNSTGGIRKDSDRWMWEHDEKIFARKLSEWGVKPRNIKLCVLDSGLGDHLCFKAILPELKAKYNDLVLAVCYTEVFKGDDVTLISIAEANMLGNHSEQNIYKKMWDWNWTGSLEDAYRRMYL